MSSSTRRRSSRPSPTNLTRPSLKCPVTENKNCSVLQLSLTSYLPCFFVYFLYNSRPHNAGCYFYLDRHKLQKATDQTLSGIIGHLYIFKLYRISANHTNVQLSPKKQYVNFLHFLSSAIEINLWRRAQNPFGISITTITISCISTCLCLFIHNNLYRSYVCHRI